MRSELVFVTLFAVATAVALAARRVRIPYTVALVLTGLVLGSAHAMEPPHLTKDLLYAIFLPGLVFEAAFHIDFKKFWESKLAVHALAVPGVVVSMVLTAATLVPAASALHFVEGFGFVHGLVFAALIAATDPIAVVGLFKTLGAPKRLAVLVEGESLLNDGTAVVFFTLVLGLASGGDLSASSAVVEFAKVAGLGALVGAGFGLATSRLIQAVDDPMIEITLTTIAAWGSFVTAEHFHLSGVISTVAAGLLCGNYGARTGMSPSTRIAVETFWEYVAFALNSLIFLLIGFEVHVHALVASWLPIVVAYLAVTLGRAAMTFGVTALLAPTRERIPWSWATVLTWGGLRGALSMVLVLGLAPDFPHRDLLVTMTFGVVILSILTQGLSMTRLMRKLGVTSAATGRHAYEREKTTLRAARQAQAALARMVADGSTPAAVAERLGDEYARRIAAAEKALADLHLAQDDLLAEEAQSARHHLLMVEKDAVLDTHRRGLIDGDVADELVRELDAKLVERDG